MPGEKRDDRILREKRVIFYAEDMEKITKLMGELLKLSDSKSNILIDKNGHLISKAGHTKSYDIQTVSALVAGSFTATREMAKLSSQLCPANFVHPRVWVKFHKNFPDFS